MGYIQCLGQMKLQYLNPDVATLFLHTLYLLIVSLLGLYSNYFIF